MLFVSLLFGSAFLIAAAAGFFSIVGLATTYGGAFWAVVAMGSTVELGKLMAVSFVYRFWEHISYTLRAALCALILGVMLITSLGVFGFLTKANQTDMVAAKQQSAQIAGLTTERTTLVDRKVVVDAQVASTLGTSTANQVKLIKEFQSEQRKLNARIPELDAKLMELESDRIKQHAEIGPLMYIASTLKLDVDIAVMWFTMLLVVVFDPLAIILTICANIALLHYRRGQVVPSTTIAHNPVPQYIQPSAVIAPQVEIPTSEEVPVPDEFSVDTERINTESDKSLMRSDWNHFVTRKIHDPSGHTSDSKIADLVAYVAELDAQPTMTDDEIILRNRIVSFIRRHQQKGDSK